MQVFFVSIRTAMIFGPGEVIEVRNTAGEQMYLRATWPYPYAFEDWEGYAVVVPERNEVWGAAQPKLNHEGEVELEFPFTPQAIPPKDLQLFNKPTQSTTQSGAPDSEDDADEVDED